MTTPAAHPLPAFKPLLAALAGRRVDPPPIWLMRQAGRYLPEYRELRSKAPDFLAFCNTPELAAEATLQPVRRFGLDAAIVFSDILVVPHAMGATVRFAEGEGPLLEPLAGEAALARLRPEAVVEGNQGLMATLASVRQQLGDATALIGFAGAPFTLAAYMIDGRGGGDFPRTRALMAEDPGLLDRLVELLARAVTDLLVAEVDAGAEAVQLFDSWAGLLDETGFGRWSVEPARSIVAELHRSCPGVPVIGFPRGAGPGYGAYASVTEVDALQVDQAVGLDELRRLQRLAVVQGNLDPRLLLAGGPDLARAVSALLDALAEGPHVVNLGHGVVKETPPEHVAELVALVRGWRRGAAA